MGTYSVQLPLDNDGFLRRQCPHCGLEFKWHNGPTADKPPGQIDPAVYYCPRCGVSAQHGDWFTQEQTNFIEESLSGHAFREATDTLQEMFRGVKGLTYKPSYDDEPLPPGTLHEPNDMIIVTPPCHPWEPVKVPEAATARSYCLICGHPFAA
jgi:ribosomal protein S27AE